MVDIRRLKVNGNNQSKNHQKKIIIKMAVFCTLVIILLTFIFKSEIFRIKKVAVLLHNTNCVSEQEIKAYINPNQNILFFDQDKLIRQLQDKYHCIAFLKTFRKYPQLLAVEIYGRIPIAILQEIKPDIQDSLKELQSTPSSQAAKLDFAMPKNTGVKYQVDKEGLIYSDNHQFPENTPLIYIQGHDISLYKQIDKGIINNAVEVVKKISSLTLNYNLVKIINFQLLVSSEPKLIFGLDKNINRQLASLQLILQKAKIDSKVIESVDLKFDKPVVIYSPKKN